VQDSRLSDRSVANIVKAHAARVGLDRAQFAGHSLRSGFLTSAAGRGVSKWPIIPPGPGDPLAERARASKVIAPRARSRES
jgi:hypothetical protein